MSSRSSKPSGGGFRFLLVLMGGIVAGPVYRGWWSSSCGGMRFDQRCMFGQRASTLFLFAICKCSQVHLHVKYPLFCSCLAVIVDKSILHSKKKHFISTIYMLFYPLITFFTLSLRLWISTSIASISSASISFFGAISSGSNSNASFNDGP